MSTQIAVWLPDELVAFVDQLVERGQATSRAAVVGRALEHERRREIATRDAEILAQAGAAPEFDRLAEFAAGVHGRSRLRTAGQLEMIGKPSSKAVVWHLTTG